MLQRAPNYCFHTGKAAEDPMKYHCLVNILDRIRKEASSKYEKKYCPAPEDIEKINQARSRAYLHLYLKVMFGLSDFDEREHTITDGSYDGGIDAYHVDTESKVIYLLQSKFRTNQRNFEEKIVEVDDLLAMDIDRVLKGETSDVFGNSYSGKILQLQREVSTTKDIARYQHRVILLANVGKLTQPDLVRLTGGFPTEVFDFEQTYSKLVLPLLAGTFFTANDIYIPLDLSNNNSGSRISYNATTRFGSCEITLLFVPTIEIAKMMHKYRNAILKLNPRSYLELEGKAVNEDIRATLRSTNSNEFALLNNGITVLSDETDISEKIGQKNRAQLRLKNPQIVNGGQTSYTLSRIYSENSAEVAEIFGGKEVLLKIITVDDQSTESAKRSLIDLVSVATNKQTPVIAADRFANEAFHAEVQKLVFDSHGILYERKRGEFSEGLREGYIKEEDVFERNLFWRLYFSANDNLALGCQKKLFQKDSFPGFVMEPGVHLDRLNLACRSYRKLFGKRSAQSSNFRREALGQLYLFINMCKSSDFRISEEEFPQEIANLEIYWKIFIRKAASRSGPWRYFGSDNEPTAPTRRFMYRSYVSSDIFLSELSQYVRSGVLLSDPIELLSQDHQGGS